MTRFLSESLQAREPGFRAGISRLEGASGHPGADISLSVEVAREVRSLLSKLGLDPNDTNPKELYNALIERVAHDDHCLIMTLRTLAATHISAEGDVYAGMVLALQKSSVIRTSFALKTTTFKALIKAQPPKKVMKQLGYRSLDSLLRHESASSTLAASVILEAPAWYRNFQDRYKKLHAADFESRKIQINYPNSKKWQLLAERYAQIHKHNLLSFPELGAIVLLPIDTSVAPRGATTASLVLALQALNQIHTTGSYLKLCQVRPDFGTIVAQIARSEPEFSTGVIEEPVSWQLLQRYYTRAKQFFSEDIFEPHFSKSELSWQTVEKFLVSIEPSFNFWKDSAHVGIVAEHRPLSFNLIDSALNFCNNVPFEQRIAHYYQKSLWHELLLRYLKPGIVEQAISSILQPPEFAVELETA